jgi:glycosyltransferase involved in cell wall biosynthesis
MRISVCIATYNGEKYIKAQLNSILSQLEEHDEVVISDDSSSDRTIEIIKQINDQRIKLYPNQRFRSPTLNFEFAISKAEGQYIFLSDQDDEWETNKVNTFLPMLEHKKLVASYFCFIDKNSRHIESEIQYVPSKGFLKNLIRPSIPGCCMAFTSELKNQILPFPKGIAMHDWWISLIAAIEGQITIVKKPLVCVRRHETNYSTTGSKSKYSIKDKLTMRYFILKKVVLYLRQPKKQLRIEI